jgi:hypothetical protein
MEMQGSLPQWLIQHWDRGFESNWMHGRMSVSCSPAYVCMCVEALRRADPLSKESYRMYKKGSKMLAEKFSSKPKPKPTKQKRQNSSISSLKLKLV